LKLNTTFIRQIPVITALFSAICDSILCSNHNEQGEATVQVNKTGTNLVKPTDPTKNNVDFIGWYSNAELTQAYTFGAINSDLNLYAKWQGTPMFYWGNYIPSVAGQAAEMEVNFDIDELVGNVEIGREIREWVPGTAPPFTPTQTGPVWATEVKSWETAVKGTKTGTVSKMGYAFFVSPTEFGDVVITDATSTQLYPGTMFEKVVIEIDSVEYNLYYKKTAGTTIDEWGFTFQYIN
jgi:uncharacterized repeat protein (TIGR02543 family)